MTIQLLTSIATADASYIAGDIVEWDDADAKKLIDAGLAADAKPAEQKQKTK